MQTHEPKQSEKRNRIAWGRLLTGTVLVLVLLPCLGCIGSVVFAGLQRAGNLSRWQALGGPPGGGAGIVAGDLDVLYVRAKSGQVYRCEHRKPEPTDCWTEAQAPYDVDPEVTDDSRVYAEDVEPPPGNVVDSLEVTIWYAEAAYETRYVLLDDGLAWRWDYEIGSYSSLFILICGPTIGLGLALLAVLGLWIWVGVASLIARR